MAAPATSFRDFLIKAEPPAFDVAALPLGQTVLNMGGAAPEHHAQPAQHGLRIIFWPREQVFELTG